MSFQDALKRKTFDKAVMRGHSSAESPRLRIFQPRFAQEDSLHHIAGGGGRCPRLGVVRFHPTRCRNFLFHCETGRGDFWSPLGLTLYSSENSRCECIYPPGYICAQVTEHGREAQDALEPPKREKTQVRNARGNRRQATRRLHWAVVTQIQGPRARPGGQRTASHSVPTLRISLRFSDNFPPIGPASLQHDIRDKDAPQTRELEWLTMAGISEQAQGA